MKIDLNNLVSVVILGVLSWGAITLFTMNAQMAVVVYKVDQNFKMIQPMWQEFLRTEVANDTHPITDVEADIHASNEEKK
jgi:hypothetical protein|tara:strand:+ start:158 stop:397 length:240 start_codon:yes stop_codon:yes gene_type:complete